jgi:hypothetical protein
VPIFIPVLILFLVLLFLSFFFFFFLRRSSSSSSHKGEIELLNAVNETLAKAKQDGELATLFKTATESYETFKHYSPGSRSLGQRPWECLSQTTVGMAKPSLSSTPAGHRGRLRLSESLSHRAGPR